VSVEFRYELSPERFDSVLYYQNGMFGDPLMSLAPRYRHFGPFYGFGTIRSTEMLLMMLLLGKVIDVHLVKDA